MLKANFALVLLIAVGSQAAWDTTLCPELINTGYLPALPDRWIVEYKLTWWNDTHGGTDRLEGYEAYDGVGKRSGYVTIYDGMLSKAYQLLADYDNSKVFVIHQMSDYTASDACTSVDMKFSGVGSFDTLLREGRLPIGNMLWFYITGTAQNPGLMGARLMSSDDSVKFRGMNVVHYEGCHYDAALDETAKVSWFYVKDDRADYLIPVGVSTTVKFPNSGYVNYRYDFLSFDYNSDSYWKLLEDTKIFEVPYLYSCKINTSVTFPDVSGLNIQSYSIEYLTLDPVQSWMKQQVEKYNYHKLLYMERDNTRVEGSLYPLTRVSDYSTGVRYNINKYLGKCTVTPLNYGLDSAAISYDDGVCMKSPSGMFGTSYKYTYDGIKNIRGIHCYSWTADTVVRDGQVDERIQWCFATNSSVAGSHPTLPITPVLLVYGYRKDNQMVLLNQELFSYQFTEPSLYTYDVSECFRSFTNPAHTMRHFVVRFPQSIATIDSVDPILFKTSFIRTVRHTTNFADIRISNVEVENGDTSSDVTFSLIPPAPIAGTLSAGCPAIQQPSIEDAANAIKSSILAGTFTVTMQRPFSNETVATVTAQASYDSFYETPRRTPQAWFVGYTAGAMIAVGLANSLVGFILGAVLFLYVIVPCMQRKAA